MPRARPGRAVSPKSVGWTSQSRGRTAAVWFACQHVWEGPQEGGRRVKPSRRVPAGSSGNVRAPSDCCDGWFPVGTVLQLASAVYHYCLALVRPITRRTAARPLEGRRQGPGGARENRAPSRSAASASGSSNRSPGRPYGVRRATTESVDCWPLAITVLRRNRGHALADIRPTRRDRRKVTSS